MHQGLTQVWVGVVQIWCTPEVLACSSSSKEGGLPSAQLVFWREGLGRRGMADKTRAAGGTQVLEATYASLVGCVCRP